MNYEITGKLLLFQEKQTGKKKDGSTWEKILFVVETLDAQYAKKVALIAWDKQLAEFKGIKIGDIIKVNFSAQSRDHNNNWYTELRAFKIAKSTDTAPAPTQSKPRQQAPANPRQEYARNDYGYEDESSDMPF